MSKLASYADKTIEYLFYALFFFVPLILWPGTSEAFEFNKMLFVYVLTILISAAWIIKWIDQKKITIRRTPLDIPILLFLLSQVLSTIFSIDTHTSLWGYYSRFHGGLMSTISYIVLYYALVTNFKQITFLIYSILGSAILVSLYGVLEHFGIDKHLWVQDVQSRVFSTLGQPNWLSAYLVALLPLPIFLALQHCHPRSNRGSIQIDSRFRGNDAVALIFYFSLAILFLITILFTKSQSGIGATLVVLAALSVYFVGARFKMIYFLILLVVLLGIVYKWSFFVKLSPFGPGNLTELVQKDQDHRIGGSDSLVIRQVVWQGARELAKKYPLFGTGVETFGYSYFSVRPALHNLLSEWEFLYNKAHNEYLNFLANTGFVGLAAYLTLIGTSLVLLWQHPALLFGYLSILITNYFGFSVVPVALFFFLFPALTFISLNRKEKYLSINYHINKELSLFLLAVLTGYLILVPHRQWRADLAFNKGKQYLSANYLKQSLASLEKATQISPNEPLFWSQLAESQAVGAFSVKQQLDSQTASLSAEFIASGEKLQNDLMRASEQNAAKAISQNPNHTNFYKQKAKAELYLGTIDAKYDQAARETLIVLSRLSPTDAKVTYNIGLLYQSAGENDQAKLYFQKALALKPDYDAARLQMLSP